MQTESLPCALTDKEVDEIATSLSRNIDKRAQLADEAKSAAEAYKGEIKALETTIGLQARKVRERKENRQVEVVERRNYDERRVETWRSDDGTLVRSRPMNPDEYQRRLPFEEQVLPRTTPAPAPGRDPIPDPEPATEAPMLPAIPAGVDEVTLKHGDKTITMARGRKQERELKSAGADEPPEKPSKRARAAAE